MRLCFSVTMLLVIKLWNYVKSEVCSKCSCNNNGIDLTATFASTCLVSSEYTDDTSIGIQKCAWIIRANDSSHAITFKMKRIITSSTSDCGDDSVLVRDGSTDNGPPLGFWCREDGTLDSEVTSYSNVIYIELDTYSNGKPGIIFVMSFWESSVSSSVRYGPVVYGIVNYVLIAASVLIGSVLIGAVVYLIYREYVKHKQEQESKFREKLLMRRPGISGRSGGIINDDFRHDSESENNTSFIYMSPTPTSDISV